MILFPEHCKVKQTIAKEKIYSHGKVSEKIKAKFVEQVEYIAWSYKLAPITLHIPPRDGVNEIQIFTIALRKQICDVDVLKAIDTAIPFPIFFVLKFGNSENLVGAYKKIINNVVVTSSIGEYFSTGWHMNNLEKIPMPSALDMTTLYVALFRQIAPLPSETGILRLEDLIEQLTEQRKLVHELAALEKKCAAEKQFHKRLELNQKIREIKRKSHPTTAGLLEPCIKQIRNDFQEILPDVLEEDNR